MNTTFRASVAALALLFAATPAFADTSDIRAADRAVEFDAGAAYQKYGENVNNASFDTETGWMPSMDAGITWLGSENSPSGPAFDNIYLHADAQVTFGDDHYSGGIQHLHGPTTPFQSTTSNTIFTIKGEVGRLFEVYDGVAVTPFLDLGYHTWSRDISGQGIVSNSNEDYSHGEALGGVLLQVSPMSGLVLSASGAAGTDFGPELSTSGTVFNLNPQPAYRIEGKIGYTLTPRWELTTTASLYGFGYDKSAVINGAYEPDSYTHELTAMAGVAYHLQ